METLNADELVALRAQLQKDEGLRLTPYVDTAGKITIGYGHNLSDNGITPHEADEWLDGDITAHVHDLLKAFPVVQTLNAARRVVLANMCFNLGIQRLSEFTKMWIAIHDHDYVKAANEMLNSHWAKQVGARAMRLAGYMAAGHLAP